MNHDELAQTYAKGLFETTKNAQERVALLNQLRELSQVFKGQPEVGQFFAEPSISRDQKRQALAPLSKQLPETIGNLLLLMVDNDRMGAVAALVQSFEALVDQENGVVRGEIRAASPLSEQELSKMTTTISKSLNKQVVLTFVQDPSVLGGVIAKVGGRVFDDSIQSHLTKLSEDLKRRTH